MKVKAKTIQHSRVVKELAEVAIHDEDVLMLKIYMPIMQLQNIHTKIARDRRNGKIRVQRHVFKCWLPSSYKKGEGEEETETQCGERL